MNLYLALFVASLSSPIMWLACGVSVMVLAVGWWQETAYAGRHRGGPDGRR